MRRSLRTSSLGAPCSTDIGSAVCRWIVYTCSENPSWQLAPYTTHRQHLGRLHQNRNCDTLLKQLPHQCLKNKVETLKTNGTKTCHTLDMLAEGCIGIVSLYVDMRPQHIARQGISQTEVRCKGKASVCKPNSIQLMKPK